METLITWVELRDERTHRYIGRYCPERHELRIALRGDESVFNLPTLPAIKAGKESTRQPIKNVID